MESREGDMDEERLLRISNLLARLNQSSQLETPLDNLLLRNPVGSDLNTAELVSRVQAFLPQLRTANDDLMNRARENPSSVDIESFQGDEDAYIQLNLGLGLFEQRLNANASEDDGTSSSGDSTGSSSDSDSSESSSSSGDETDSTNSEEDQAPDLITLVTGTRPILPLPKPRRRQIRHQHHPGIVILSSSLDNAEALRSDAPPETGHLDQPSER